MSNYIATSIVSGVISIFLIFSVAGYSTNLALNSHNSAEFREQAREIVDYDSFSSYEKKLWKSVEKNDPAFIEEVVRDAQHYTKHNLRSMVHEINRDIKSPKLAELPESINLGDQKALGGFQQYVSDLMNELLSLDRFFEGF